MELGSVVLVIETSRRDVGAGLAFQRKLLPRVGCSMLELFCRDRKEAAWRDQAVCQEKPYSEWEWIPEDTPDAMLGFKEACMSCSVRSECAAYAVANQCEGIWAGKFYPPVWWRESGGTIVDLTVESTEETQ